MAENPKRGFNCLLAAAATPVYESQRGPDMQPKWTIACSALLALLAGCASQQTATAPRENTTTSNRSGHLNERWAGSDERWATATEAELKRRTGDIRGYHLLAVRCATLSCTFEVATDRPDNETMNSLLEWLRANWSFRWRIEGSTLSDAGREPMRVTLYRHPADVATAPGDGYSSFKGRNDDPCAQGADCRHPNWDEPHICERNAAECPSIDFNGTHWCFDKLQIACACAKRQGERVERQLPGCNEEGYPY